MSCEDLLVGLGIKAKRDGASLCFHDFQPHVSLRPPPKGLWSATQDTLYIIANQSLQREWPVECDSPYLVTTVCGWLSSPL